MTVDFKPRLDFWELKDMLHCGASGPEKRVQDTAVHSLAAELASLVVPAREDRFERRWEGLYVPAKKLTKMYLFPYSMTEYDGDFFAAFDLLGSLQISKGKVGGREGYRDVFSETMRFLPVIRKTQGKIIGKAVPYEFRRGRIRGEFVLDKLLPKSESGRIKADYERHLRRGLRLDGCSLNEYLETAALCYRSVFKTGRLSALEMYGRWADKRHGGMLDIADRSSREEFSRWYRSGSWSGCHPFEIVFSLFEQGIMLEPPSDRPFYILEVDHLDYAPVFVKMSEALAKKGIPFVAERLSEVVDYLAGDTLFSVNDYSEPSIRYYGTPEERRKYSRHIEWEAVRVPKLRLDVSSSLSLRAS